MLELGIKNGKLVVNDSGETAYTDTNGNTQMMSDTANDWEKVFGKIEDHNTK